MTLDLRLLFNKYRIEWRDKGANCTKGHVNIACPMCKSDPSFHLGISETPGEGYYCYRNPKHAGRSLGYLFSLLRIPFEAYAGYNIAPGVQSAKRVIERDYTPFRFFEPAETCQETLDYLTARGFGDPIAVSKKFNLKWAPNGHWAARLIIPLTIGWTGRAMRPGIEPRYLAHTDEDGFFLYRNRSTSVVLFEGALDAMRIASISAQFDVIAKCGNRLSAALINHLMETGYMSIYNAPDGDVNFLQAYQETSEIRSYCHLGGRISVQQIKFPTGIKDAAEMSEQEAREWIMKETSQQRLVMQ